MKIVALLLSIMAIVSSAVALKDPACNMQYAKNGDGQVNCMGYFPKWSFNSEGNECRLFIFGGCKGNGNSFNTREECESTCMD